MPGTPGRQAVSLPYPWIEGLDKRQQTQIYEDFQALARQGNGTRWATLVIAASDSTTKSRSKADYVCNGSNDAAQIQTAINEIASRSKPGRIVFLEGTYTITTPLVIDTTTGHEVVLQGMSVGKDGNSNCILQASGLTSTSVLRLNGSDLFSATPFPNFGLIDMTIINGAGGGVEFVGNTYGSVMMDRCYISGGPAFWTSSASLLSSIQGCFLTNSTFISTGGNYAIDISASTEVVIADCQITGASAGGIALRSTGGDGGHQTIRNCRIDGSTSIGILMWYDNFSGVPSDRCILDGNRISGFDYGIYMQRNNSSLIHGNYIYNCHTYGIRVDSGASYGSDWPVVQSNEIVTCSGGIYISGFANRASVIGNVVRNTSPSYVVDSTCSNTMDLANDWGTGTISDSGSGSVHYSPGAVTDWIGYHRARKNSTGSTFARHRFNFIEGVGVTITVADDSVDDEVDITITSAITSLIAAKGDLLVGLAAGTIDRLPTDRDGQILVSDSGTLRGVKWGPKLTVSKTAPTSPMPGDIWMQLP